MAANVPNPALFLQRTAEQLTALRDDFARLANRADYVAAMGGATFLTAAAPNGLGLGAGDAAALVAALNNHKNLSIQYLGGTQAAAMDYRGQRGAVLGRPGVTPHHPHTREKTRRRA